jgi:DnaJ-class molecular chaperone
MPVNKFERISAKHYRSTYVAICRNCKGSGHIISDEPGGCIEDPCPICSNSGRVVITKEIYINVEPFNN